MVIKRNLFSLKQKSTVFQIAAVILICLYLFDQQRAVFNICLTDEIHSFGKNIFQLMYDLRNI